MIMLRKRCFVVYFLTTIFGNVAGTLFFSIIVNGYIDYVSGTLFLVPFLTVTFITLLECFCIGRILFNGYIDNVRGTFFLLLFVTGTLITYRNVGFLFYLKVKVVFI